MVNLFAENMKTIGFDFDNTLVDCIRSDYAVYTATCRAGGLTPLPLDFYAPLRRKGRYDEVLSGTGVVDREAFLVERNRIALDESLCHDDALILDVQLLDRLAEKFHLAIVSSRESEEGLRRQVRKLGLERYFTVNVVPRGEAALVARAKQAILTELDVAHFVGDKLSDLDATHGTAAEPVLVATGFQPVTTTARTFPDVNHFVRTLLD